MRVIAGSLKGRRLTTPKWGGVRPTSDRLRETLFNILAPRVVDARVLDGYAGTGAVGIEALSRGAAHVTFVERDRRAEALIAENLARCGIADRHAIIRASVERAIETLRVQAGFDLVLLDPPYAEDIDAVLVAVGEILAPGGLLILEHARRRPAPERVGRHLVRTRDVVAGDSTLSFFEVER
jgi:16S rRNA (guanine(966)-N(2))-methyltransferase RsmD